MIFLSGCEAVARGAWEGGANFLCSYPGSPVTGIVDAFKQYPEIDTQWVANEKVGMEVAVGNAHAGMRSLVVMKHVGLNVAADPFFNAAYTGVRGALVVVVGDDPGAKSSQNEQDTRLLAFAAKIPVLEPSSINEVLIFTRLAFEISHRFDIPVVLRLTTQLCYGSSHVVTGTRKVITSKPSFAKPIQKYLLLPKFVPELHKNLNQRLNQLENSHWNRWFVQYIPAVLYTPKFSFGIVVSGFPSSFVIETFSNKIPILKIGMCFPLNILKIRNFAKHCERILVVEESSRFIEQQLRAMNLQVAARPYFDGVGEFHPRHMLSPDIPELKDFLGKHLEPQETKQQKTLPIPDCEIASISLSNESVDLELPIRPPGFCAGCSHRGIFYELSKRDLYVVGDIGCYTLGALGPYHALHTNLCMGASIGLLQGYLRSMDKQAAKSTVVIIGDSTFFHSGIPSLMTAVAADITATIIILDNSGAAMTGHQTTGMHFTLDDWKNFLAALKVSEFAIVDALNINTLVKKLDQFLDSDKLSIMVLKGDCVQGIKVKKPTNYRYTILDKQCDQCGECLKVDCPAIVPTRDRDNQIQSVSISIDCIGCGLCSQTCDTHAIVPRTVNSTVPILMPVLSRLPWRTIIRELRRVKPIRLLLEKNEKETY